MMAKCFRRVLAEIAQGLGRVMWLAILCILFVSTAANAQNATARITGRVADSSGAAVADATVVATETQTGVTREARTGSDGMYVLSQLLPGPYRIAVQKSGFGSAEVDVATLQVNQILTQDITLKVGSVTSSVQVSAAGEVMQTASSEVGAVIDANQVHDTPLNGRNFTQLITLVPGVTPVSTGQAAYIGTGPISTIGIPGSTFAQPPIQGQWTRMDFYTLDGAINVASISGSYDVLPIIDSIQEFKVQSHSDQAEFGSVLGGVVNVVTKGGTNNLHGSAWEYVRNNVFDAKNPFSGQNVLHQNEFGATAGAPLIIPKLYHGRDKTFLYFGFEGWRYSSPQSKFLTVPTDEELDGNFSHSLLVNGTTGQPLPIYDPVTQKPYANNIIAVTPQTPTGLDTTTHKFLQTYLDRPNFVNTTNPLQNDLVASSLVNTNNTYNGRIDQRFGANNSVFFRITKMNYQQTSPDSNKTTSYAIENPTNYALGYTHIFSPSLLADGHFGYARMTYTQNDLPNADVPTIAAAGFTSLVNPGYPSISTGSIYSGMGGGDSMGYLNRKNNNFSASGNVEWIHGNHDIRGGLQFLFLGYSCCLGGPYPGTTVYGFTGNQTSDGVNVGTTGNGLASALTGYLSGVATSSQTFNLKYPAFAPYVQDQWRVNKKLTVNLGFRVDHYPPPHITNHGLLSEFDPNSGDWVIGTSSPLPNCVPASSPCIPVGAPYVAATGNTGGLDVSAANHIAYRPESQVAPSGVWNYGPRIGFAYAVSPTIAVRAGFGIVADTLSGVLQTVQANIGSWPQSNQSNVSYNPTAAGQPATTTIEDATKNRGLALPGPTPFTSANWMYDPKLKNPYSEQWNFEIQQQLTAKSSLTLGYVGSADHRLPVTVNYNVGAPGGHGNNRPFLYYPISTEMAFSNGWSNFNALEVKVQGHPTDGLDLLASYTWSKSLDVASGYFGAESGAGNSFPQNPADLRGDYGPSGFNISHYFVASVIYALPFGHGQRFLQHGLASWVVGNWQVNTTTYARSGQPFNVGASNDLAQICPGGACLFNIGYERADVHGNPYSVHRGKTHWLNASSFAVPALGTFGNSSRNMFTSPSVFNSDLSLFKAFPLGDKAHLQFRAEAFNFLNHPTLGLPAANISSPIGFGAITSTATNPRQMQLGLRLEY